jgi:hypothetical protein
MTMVNVKIQSTEFMVGQNHATLSDTLNRCAVGLNNFRLIKSGANLTLEPVNGNLVDINGDVYAVTTLPTLAAPSTAIQIEGMTRAAACVVTWTGHGFTAIGGQKVFFSGLTQTGWTALNGNTYEITYIGANSFSIPVNTSGYAGDYVPGTDPGTIDKETVYYIYLYSNAGTAALEASTTGYTVDTKGRANKTGDATRRLMGMARTIQGPAWVDTAAQRFVRSYDNDLGIGCLGWFTTARNTNSTSWVEVNAEIRCGFLSWPGDVAKVFIGGTGVYPTGAGGDCYTAVGIDGTTAEEGSSLGTQASATFKLPIGVLVCKTGLTTGYHYATLLGKKGGAATTVEWYGGASAELRVSIQVHIDGRN